MTSSATKEALEYQRFKGAGVPTVAANVVYQLVDGEYAINLFRGSDRIQSSIFPELNLTAEQIFRVGQ